MNSDMETFLAYHYQRSFEKLKQDQRAYPRLSSKELELLLSYYQDCLTSKPLSSFWHQIFFILSYIQNETLQFEAPLLSIFTSPAYSHLPEDTKIIHLSAIQKQLIKVYKKQGLVIPQTILAPLNEQLQFSSPSFQYWILLFLSDLGPELSYFEHTLRQVRPSFLKLFLPHYNKMLPLIDALLKQIPPHLSTRKNDSAR